jgi:hypothetical protein
MEGAPSSRAASAAPPLLKPLLAPVRAVEEESEFRGRPPELAGAKRVVLVLLIIEPLIIPSSFAMIPTLVRDKKVLAGSNSRAALTRLNWEGYSLRRRVFYRMSAMVNCAIRHS